MASPSKVKNALNKHLYECAGDEQIRAMTVMAQNLILELE
jgi:hypothetical protein